MTYNDMWLHWVDDERYEVCDPKMPLIVTGTILAKDLDPRLYVMGYGKFAGRNLRWISYQEGSYLDWLKDNDNCVLLQQCIINL